MEVNRDKLKVVWIKHSEVPVEENHFAIYDKDSGSYLVFEDKVIFYDNDEFEKVVYDLCQKGLLKNPYDWFILVNTSRKPN